MDHGRRRDQLELPGSTGPRLAVSGDEEAERLTKTQDRQNKSHQSCCSGALCDFHCLVSYF